MTNFVEFLVNVMRNVFRIFSFAQIPLKNTLNIFIKCNTGNTLAVNLDPKWDIKDVKNMIAPKIGASPNQLKIIFAGKELDDSITIEDCDLGEQSMLHAIKLRSDRILQNEPKTSAVPEIAQSSENLLHNSASNSFKNESLSALSNDSVDSVNSNDKFSLIVEKKDNKIHFFVYCDFCNSLRIGKLRVRCSKCKSGAITVDSDPKSWDDVLKPGKISGHCEQDGCPDNVFGWAEFYFKCAEHKSRGENDSALPLKQIKNNSRNIPCLACTEIKEIVFIFSCKDAHVTCLECFRTYAVLKLRERQFQLHEDLGYTISCPAGCANSYIDEPHNFKLLTKEQYEMYQKFATEEAVLNAGGVLCPMPGCGEGIIVDSSCNKVTCINGCRYVFCKICREGYHIGDCSSSDNVIFSDDNQNITDATRAFQARWDEASSIAIKVTTKPCPKCKTATERSGGCMHMICTRCSFHWCWICQTEWNRDCMGAHWFG